MRDRRVVSGPRGRRGWAAAAALSLLLTAACTSGTGEGDATTEPTDGTAATGEGEATTEPDGNSTATSATDGNPDDSPTADPVDVVAALSQFQAPPVESRLEAADPAQCPGATSEHFLSIFPDATPFQGTSLAPEPPDLQEGELLLQCRLSFEVELLDDECTVMEVRDVSFTPGAVGSLGSHRGMLTTTSSRTYFTGMAQKDTVVLDYTLEAGCDGTADLSDLENEFRSVWMSHRDQFMATPTYERP